uniref:Uncharacterized protein n=1 Tax=Globisporangium ultimum (strain ATCC 200006 / CBS 805.95 / DAOM BR144) TaxID=431595 RepID=K3WGI6_GLOUD
MVFGWPLLLLQDEHQYHELYHGAHTAPSNQNNANVISSTCDAQQNRFNLMFAVASIMANAMSLPISVFLDVADPKCTTVAAATTQVLALLLLAHADSQRFDVFLPAYALLALDGSVATMALHLASFVILRCQAGILAAVSCMYNGSSAVFVMVRSWLHEKAVAVCLLNLLR